MRKKHRQPLFVLWKERFIRHCRTGVIFQEKLAKTHRVSDLFDVLPFSIYCLCYQPHKPFCFVTAVCTVDLLILKTFAAARTVAPVSSMYSPKTSALSCVASFIQSTPLKASHTLSHRLIVLCLFKFPRQFELNNVLQFFEPANNIRGEAMIAASAGIGVFPKRSGSVCHIAEKSDNIFEDIFLKACPH